MKAYIINLKGANDRFEHCKGEVDKARLQAKFVHGYDNRGHELKHAQDWISSQIGVSFSHYMVNEEIRHGELNEPILIFEDDFKLCDDFLGKLVYAIDRLPDDWQIACLCWFGRGHTIEPVNETWVNFTGGDIWGCCAYLVNGSKGAESVCNAISPIWSHIDRMLWESCRDGKLKGYFIKDGFVQQLWDFKSQNI